MALTYPIGNRNKLQEKGNLSCKLTKEVTVYHFKRCFQLIWSYDFMRGKFLTFFSQTCKFKITTWLNIHAATK